MQQEHLRTVSINDIVFEEPSDAVRAFLRQKHIESNRLTLIVGLVVVTFVYLIVFVKNYSLPVYLIIMVVTAGILLLNMFRVPKCTVRFGTVTDYYRKEFDDSAYDYVTLRLDDEGVIVHNLQVGICFRHEDLTGVPVLICKVKKRYLLYSPDGLKPSEWVKGEQLRGLADQLQPAVSLDKSAAPYPGALPAQHETTIDRITFYPLPEDVYNQISRKVGERTKVIRIIAIAFGMSMLFPLSHFILALIGYRHWYIVVPVFAAIAALTVFLCIRYWKHGTSMASEADLQLTGVCVRVTSSKMRVEPMRITFVIDETGQTIVDQRIAYTYCGLNVDGQTVLLVRNGNKEYSIYPIDQPFRT